MYKLTQEQEILRETIRDFAQKEIAPHASKIDWECTVPAELLAKLPGLGLFGITVPAESGGANADFLSLVISTEELCRVSGSLGAQLSFHNAVVCEAFLASENSKIRKAMLQRLAAGVMGAFSFFSANENSQVLCKIDGKTLLVNGNSSFVMSAAVADIFLVSAKIEGTQNSVIFGLSKNEVEGLEGEFVVGGPKKLLGMRASATSRISFHNLKLPLESILFDIAKTEEAMSQLNARARLAVAAQALGLAQASIDASVKYANERSQFNTKIGKFYAVQDMIASDIVGIETSRAICYDVASGIRTTMTLQRDSAIAKISASNCANQAARHSIRIHGGYGYTRDYPVERYARDARLTQIYTESNEELKSLIANSALGKS